MNSNKIVNVTTPTVAADAANKSYVDTSIPIGGIIMWSGSHSSLPTNWKFCDGTNGTPDLRGRFVLCTNRQLDNSLLSIGPLNQWVDRNTTGGSPNAVVVSHSHGITDPGHTHNQWNGQDNNYLDGTGGINARRMSSGNYSGTIINTNTTGISIKSEGVDGTDKNLPPYYALAYIMRIS
jgi:hypothetical protein